MAFLNPPADEGLASSLEADLERCPPDIHDTSYLKNRDIKEFSWSGVTVQVVDRETKQPKKILSDVNGYLVAGMISSSIHSLDRLFSVL
jgi:hypothetical protein